MDAIVIEVVVLNADASVRHRVLPHLAIPRAALQVAVDWRADEPAHHPAIRHAQLRHEDRPFAGCDRNGAILPGGVDPAA
jgi:hypothetical protein